jgi:hypothetical protein
MYLINIKISRKEGSKPSNEQYLVDAVNLTDVETKLNNEFRDIPFFITSCKDFKTNDIFENGEGSFFLITLLADDMDSKTIKELYLQEASDNDTARSHFAKNVNYGTIMDIISKQIMGIIR